MPLDALDYLAAGGAALAAGAVNALAGGGTLISFPTLIGLGVPAVAANVTNTVSLVPGYLGGSWAQRSELKPQLASARILVFVSALGGLAGSILLVSTPEHTFRVAVPYLIVLSCALLLLQDRLKSLVVPEGADPHRRPALIAAVLVFFAAVYGGFFGAGLGIMLLAVLGLCLPNPLKDLNALKQGLSFVINVIAAVFFAFSGHVRWELVPVMAAGSVIGGFGGGRLVRVIDAGALRLAVVVAGVAVAISFWVA